MSQASSTLVEPSIETTVVDDAVAVVRRREAPIFFIIDANGTLVLRPVPSVDDMLVARAVQAARDVVDGALGHQDGSGSTVALFGDRTMVRVLRLAPVSPAATDNYFGVFIERYQDRNGIADAIERFRLSAREAQVLELLVRGESSTSMARRLFISESTVYQHVKNIARKTSSTKRSEIVASVLGLR